MKRIIAMLLAAMMVFALCACGQQAAPAAAPAAPAAAPAAEAAAPAAEAAAPAEVNMDEQTIVIGIQSDPATLEPWAVMGEGRIDVMRCIYEYMFDYPQIGGEIYPAIASGYEKTDDVTYVVTIYDYITDSAGNKITADDIVFSYKTAIELNNQPAGLSTIESVTALDATTVEFKFNSRAAGAFENAMTNVAIVSQKAYEADPDHMVSKPIGTGPYVLTEFVPGSSVSYTKRADYWQTDASKTAMFSQANIGNVTYKIIPEASQLSIALESGDVDLAYFISTADIHRFEGVEGYTVVGKPRDLAEVILFNCTEGNPFADVKVRQAACYAIDSASVLQAVYNGAGTVCKTYGSSLFADFNPKWENEDYYDYDIDKAKALMAEAGYENGVAVRILTDNGTAHSLEAQVLQAMLGEAGFQVEILAVDNALFNTERFNAEGWDIQINAKSSFDYVSSVWKFSFDQNMYKGATSNFYTDAKLQELMDTALDSTTHTTENVDALHYYLKDLALGYGMCNGTNYLVHNAKVNTLAVDFKTRVPAGSCTFNPEAFA